MSAFFFTYLINFFFPLYTVVKQTPVLVFHTTQRVFWEISVKCLSRRDNDVVPCKGIELATLRLPARRSNQLSYAAAYNNVTAFGYTLEQSYQIFSLQLC